MGASEALASAGSGAVSGGMAGSAAGPWGIAAGAGIGLLAGIVGYLVESGYEDEARKIEEAARDQYGNISDESVQAAAAKVLGPTALSRITADPRFRVAQEESLAALKEISDGGGYSLEDRANLNRFQNESDRRASQQRQAALERLASRGLGGSGIEVQQNIAAQQDAANRDAQAGLDIAAQGRKRALDAILARGDLASRMESNDWSRQAQVATAQDAIDRFNNVQGYDRAADAYDRARDNANRQIGFAQRRADNERASGRRLAGAISGAAHSVGNAVTSYSAQDQYGAAGSPLQTASDAPAKPARAAADGYSDDDSIRAIRDAIGEDD